MAYPDFIPEEVDHWAVGLVVNEGVRMNLNYSSQVVAARKMMAMRLGEQTIAMRLRTTEAEAEALIKRGVRADAKDRQSLSVIAGSLGA